MAKMASVGKLRHRLKIKKPVRTDDGGGSGKVTFEDVGTVFGNIMPTGGGETFFGMQLEKRITHVITLRYGGRVQRRNLDHTNILVYEFLEDGEKYTRTFNIRRVIDNKSRRQYLDIQAEEGVNT
jgi:SPP1 family predicted phage head-tail adaptor